MLVNKELEFVREAFVFMGAMGQLKKPEEWLTIDYYYFLLRLGFDPGDDIMKKQGFPGPSEEEPVTFKVGRTDVLSPEEFEEAMRRR